MEKIRISAVRYANTYPFIYGLTESGFDKKAIIETDHPSACAAKLITGRADLGLIPVAAIPVLKESLSRRLLHWCRWKGKDCADYEQFTI